ncbi:MAG: carbohydrate binding domain-containing protein [Lachnospiraceae bacterium]|nr:carbohydrate binding domain-containing protein [Lachnospiraceae bacterium]
MKTITIYQQEGYKELGDLYGLFFEDINHAADGGLYGELVQNRSFEFCEVDKPEYHSLTAWEKSDNLVWSVETGNPLNKENTHYLHVEAKKGSCIRNQGYNSGIYVEAGKNYDFSVYLRTTISAKITIAVRTDEGKLCAEAALMVGKEKELSDVGDWYKYELVLTATETTYEGRLVLTFEEGVYDLDMVSLFPQDTFLGKKGGLRRDIAEALQEMKPKFMRFPGGCLVHDGSLNDKDRNSMYRWRRTLGPVEERPTWRNNWRYNQTLGLGYYEYFCFCEEIGAKPLPVLPGGFNPHKGEGVPMEDLQEWVQEALDLVEFANGTADSKWGAVRAGMGHPESFGLEYLGIGNEEIGEGFFERYPYFHNAIRAKYPEIKLINTAGPFSVGEGYEDGWNSARKYGSDLVDEHYYSSPEWFLANMHHYDDFDEKGPKVFLGGYASWGNTFYNALVEAAYMTHLEKAKAVALACYAPMLCNVDYVNWKPDMLWFDNHRILKTPNYYVQKLFMSNQGTAEVAYSTSDLDEVIVLTDNPALHGDITIMGNDVEGRIWDITFTNTATGESRKLPDFMVDKENVENYLTEAACDNYSLEFSFKRSAGRKGLKIYFGKKDSDNSILWEFGGWDNWDCNLTEISMAEVQLFPIESSMWRIWNTVCVWRFADVISEPLLMAKFTMILWIDCRS